VSHYTAINGLMTTYASQGLNALGFPCNQFANQEPGANSEILNGLKYVRPGNGFVPAFNLTQLVSVNGAFTDPIWKWIRAACPAAVTDLADGLPLWLPITTSDVAWNFETILIGRNGQPYRRYATGVDPKDCSADIQILLSQK